MKKIYLLICCFVLTFAAIAQDEHSAGISTSALTSDQLTTADWQSDLIYLQQTVHKDYPFLFKKVTAREFDAAVDKLHKAMPGMKQHEKIAGLLRIVALFKYGHTRIGLEQSQFKSHVVPVNLHWFKDGIYIEGADKKYAALVGGKLVKVEGVPVKQAMEAVKLLFPAENHQFFKAFGLDHLTNAEALHAQGISKSLTSTITYTIEKNGKTMDHSFQVVESFRFPRIYGMAQQGSDWVSARGKDGTPNYLKHLDKNYYYEYLPHTKTVYVRQSLVRNDPEESIEAFYNKVFAFIDNNDVEKLVLDVRLNSGGNNYLNKPVVTGIVECKKINQPGKLFVIIGRRTFSACQNLVNEIHNYTNALFVGEPTGENINFYGDNRPVTLPKTGIPVFLSYAWWQDKPQWENDEWLAPQVAVEMSFAQYVSNKDPLLETCLAFTDKDVVLDPLGWLKELYMAGKQDQVITEAKKMVADPKYRFMNFESKINRSGYDLINKNQLEPAYFVFNLNTQLFPTSANVWDSFAEVNHKMGKTNEAIKFYNKVIELDPHGNTGGNAKEMLRQIAAEKNK